MATYIKTLKDNNSQSISPGGSMNNTNGVDAEEEDYIDFIILWKFKR